MPVVLFSTLVRVFSFSCPLAQPVATSVFLHKVMFWSSPWLGPTVDWSLMLKTIAYCLCFVVGDWSCLEKEHLACRGLTF